jgi:endonuclease/exonuclease/phosphatase family metal-dependent hydrolase
MTAVRVGRLPPVRLATFNILHGRSLEDDRVDLDRYAAAIRDLDADVLALQEVDRDQPRSHGADLTAVAAEAMGATEHRFVAALSGSPGATWMAATGDEQPGTAHYGIALLSRFPVRSWEVVRLPVLPFPTPVLFPGRRRPVVVTDEPRVAVIASLDTPEGPLTVAGTHLSFVPGWYVVQARRLLRALRPCREPVVLMGDLNVEPPRAARMTGLRPLVDGATFPAHAPSRQLDHILVRGGLAPTSPGGTRRLPLSDHRALMVDVQRA